MLFSWQNENLYAQFSSSSPLVCFLQRSAVQWHKIKSSKSLKSGQLDIQSLSETLEHVLSHRNMPVDAYWDYLN